MNPDVVKKMHGDAAPMKEWTKLSHNAQLDIGLLQAYFVQHAYPRHSHDYFVICLIETGRQTFTHKGSKYSTPPGGVILINPGAVHTGEAADSKGFEMRSLYPTVSHMETAVSELTGRHQALPFFKDVRTNDRWARDSILALCKAISQPADPLECESRFLWTLTQLIKRYADVSQTEPELGHEKQAITRARRYIEENFSRGVRLKALAEYVALSPYYFLRSFHSEVGMPPYAYLENVRVRQAQRLIEAGKSLVDVTMDVGFSSQSHLTRHFKRIIGVTPGQYAQQVRS